MLTDRLQPVDPGVNVASPNFGKSHTDKAGETVVAAVLAHAALGANRTHENPGVLRGMRVTSKDKDATKTHKSSST